MMVPVILIAIGAFYVYVKLKPLNSMGGLVLAHTILAMPLVLVVVSSALKSYDMNQDADQVLGDHQRAPVLPHLLRRGDHRACSSPAAPNSTLTRNMFNWR